MFRGDEKCQKIVTAIALLAAAIALQEKKVLLNLQVNLITLSTLLPLSAVRAALASQW